MKLEMKVLCCLMTSGLSKNIRCHVCPYPFLCLQVIRSDISPIGDESKYPKTTLKALPLSLERMVECLH